MNTISVLSEDQIRDIVGHTVRAVMKEALSQREEPTQKDDPLDDFIPKSEVRGKFASSSTLWKYEKQGKLRAYGFGGKRYYKRSELLEAFKLIKQKEAENA